MLKPGIVYLITNLVNGKVYVGQTTRSLRIRWGQHKLAARKHPETYLHFAINKYGESMFSVSIVATAQSSEELDCLEKRWILMRSANHRDYGYNMTAGGDGSSNVSEESKQKRIAKMRGRTLSPEHRKKLSDALRGRPQSMSHREALKRAWKPRNHTPEGRERQRLAVTGRKVSGEQLANMRAAAKRRVYTPELRAIYREAGFKSQAVLKARGRKLFHKIAP